jgi:DNA sulfur modification protein DndD
VFDYEINHKTFEVTLIKMDKEDQIRTPKKDLSEGEKQMYALAVLWTLTKISKRPLPFIIDTPLGRLDHTHRKKLVESFFPNIIWQL